MWSRHQRRGTCTANFFPFNLCDLYIGWMWLGWKCQITTSKKSHAIKISQMNIAADLWHFFHHIYMFGITFQMWSVWLDECVCVCVSAWHDTFRLYAGIKQHRKKPFWHEYFNPKMGIVLICWSIVTARALINQISGDQLWCHWTDGLCNMFLLLLLKSNNGRIFMTCLCNINITAKKSLCQF